jgi:Zn finger protein HypA/HybF involved in hydrogenase expression
MVAGIVLFGLGLHWQSNALQVIGGLTASVAFLFLFITIALANSARCPSCSIRMTQGWDEKIQSSDGIFTCPKCHSRWRTCATWGYE